MFELAQWLQWATNNTLLLILGIIGIGFLIGIHELGHFLMCKLFRIDTPSFSIGFGPTIFSYTFATTTFTLRAIPLGGYVEIAGLAEPGQGSQEEAYRADQQSFRTKPYHEKLLVALGGIISNIIFSITMLTGILYVGAPKTLLLYPYNASHVISDIHESETTPHSLQPGDRITHIHTEPVTSGLDVIKHTQQRKEQPIISITYQRNNKESTATISPSLILRGNITLELTTLQASSLYEAVRISGHLLYNMTLRIYYALYHVVTQRKTSNIGGPLMIIAASMQGAQSGILTFLLFLSFLSINLAALNILPIPVLDGGHIIFLTIEAIMGRPIPQKLREYIDYIFALLLILCILMTSFLDIWKLIPW